MDESKPKPPARHDLDERTAKFAESVIRFVRNLERNAVMLPIISQLIRVATSIGANYCEADNAESKRDFRHKIGLCRKESRETMYWLRMLATAAPDCAATCRELWKEVKQLHLIFVTIFRKSQPPPPP